MQISELDQFQNTIDEILFRNKSLLDQITKLQEACAKLSRTVTKCATSCGCIQINVSKQHYPIEEALLLEQSELQELEFLLSTHVEGFPCPNCMDILEKDIGRTLFYLGSICNTFGLSLSSIVSDEQKRCTLLGKYAALK
jgi:hypothetical protein